MREDAPSDAPVHSVLVVPTGVANLASVRAALARVACEPVIARAPEEILAASHVLVPGVGAFAAGLAMLRAQGFAAPLRERVQAGRPTLAVCLGMQILCAASEESPGVPGLGVIDDTVRRFGGPVRVPQFGWNETEPDPGCRFVRAGYAYFANSYHLSAAPPGFAAAWSTHGVRFVAGLERGDVVLCQFHPELSSAFGQALLRRWTRTGTTC